MKRPKEITKQFLAGLDKHMLDLKSGKAESTFEVQDIASLLHIHPTHLSNTIKEELKKSPSDIYEEKLMGIAKTKRSRLKENIVAAEIKFTVDELNFLNSAFPEGAFAGTRYAAPHMGMVVN